VYLENIVFDATDPHTLGRFWEQALGTETLTDEPEGYETRLALPDGPVLDLCFQRVPDQPGEPQRLHLDLHGAEEQQQVVDRLVALGAGHADIGQGQVPWVVLADPAGNPFCVMEERAEYAGSGPLAALPLDVADPQREQDFYAWLTGWVPVEGSGLLSLRHPSGRGPLLELAREDEPKGTAKNRRRGGAGNRRARWPRAPLRLGRPALAALRGPVRQRVLRAAVARLIPRTTTRAPGPRRSGGSSAVRRQ
jgi:hypothetical protein